MSWAQVKRSDIKEQTNTIRSDTKKEARSAAMLINIPIAYRYKYGERQWVWVRQKRKPKVIKVRLKKCFFVNKYILFTTEKGCCSLIRESACNLSSFLLSKPLSACEWICECRLICFFYRCKRVIQTAYTWIVNCKRNNEENGMLYQRAHCSKIIVAETDTYARCVLCVRTTNHETLQICSIPYRLFGTENPHTHATAITNFYYTFRLIKT